MLPWWVNDTATLLTIVLAAPPITGWLLHWLGRGLQPELPPPREDIRRYRQRVTIVGSLKTALIHIAINPEEPFWQDVAKVVFGTVILLGDSIYFLLLSDVQTEWRGSLSASACFSFPSLAFSLPSCGHGCS